MSRDPLCPPCVDFLVTYHPLWLDPALLSGPSLLDALGLREVALVSADRALEAQTRLPFEDVLDTGLSRIYEKPLYEQKCSALFEHIYESYQGEGQSVFAAAA